MKILAFTITVVSFVGAYVIPQVLTYFDIINQAFQGLGF